MLLCVLSGRLIWIEMVQGESLDRQARAHYEGKMKLPAHRGRIFDRNGELLARNQTVYSLVVDCHHLRDMGLSCIGLSKKEGVSALAIKKKYLPTEIRSRYREYVVESMAAPLRIPKHTLGKKLKERERGEIILAKELEDDFASELAELLEDKSIGGLYLRKEQRRYYPSPSSLTHVIGYVSGDGIGLEGVEKVFDAEMQGTPGHRYVERDRARREIHAYRGKHVEPVAGKDVHLTIDMGLQSALEVILDEVVEDYHPVKVSSVWMDPSNGEVLAMGSRPHFDLETRKGSRRNLAITDQYQPGSTFKIVAYAGAFDRGLVTPTTPIDCYMGNYTLEGFTMKDHHDYGVLTAEMAFAKSSNIGAYMVARPLNQHVFHYYMNQFGFGKETGIELTAEAAGRVYPVEKWTSVSFSSMAMGYEVAVTPLQIAAAGAAIANKGVYNGATILKGIQDQYMKEPVKDSKNGSRRVVSANAANQVKRCMVRALKEGGTGTNAAIPGYTIAGKTGTARKHVENVGYVNGKYIVSFLGFFPADDPKILGLVVIDEPKADGVHLYGGTVAAPVFKKMAEKAIKLMGIAPDVPEEIEALRAEEALELSQNIAE